MKVSIPTENGALAAQYSKQATADQQYKGHPIISFPVQIADVPTGTQSLAFVFYDDDAIPVGGFTWIHWIAANLPADTTAIPANASQTGVIPMIQGNNSTAGGYTGETDLKVTQHYVGPYPPDQDHDYTFKLYALDTQLPLSAGYWLNNFYKASAGHILATAQTVVVGKK
ncbi:YbhB/YbcL family Raf kinase inhibitor-like protein [Lactiplantibacillus sp. WILCCON 0030]|uniref:YbhB/YbcL family Raf kinase inhibitor-like protein n=1 Tax=Lactiplantibacillus brownii TaxID=3069269 RepID=A0ABU1A5W7_9LACO|nr:YbhB/YbcL family Raf kinase inhibitor-like protein [Lactiplantibacillus brownii]MDQ7936355.1 YbhB/YbcL family Raf kinase inhibitor-like protein [Lactiplantibacillus brownii]